MPETPVSSDAAPLAAPPPNATTATAEVSGGAQQLPPSQPEPTLAEKKNGDPPKIWFTTPITIGTSSTGNLILNFSGGQTPADGVIVDLKSSDTSLATVPATAKFEPRKTTVNVPATGVGPGSAVITASAPNLASADIKVTITPSTPFYRLNLNQYGQDVEKVALAMWWSLFIGLILAGLGAWHNWVFALLWGGACSAVGWILGFLFGIPRTLSGQPEQQGNQAIAAVQESSADSGAPAKASVTIAPRTNSVNTNLEQVSDWLTKILVGVGLVEWANVKPALVSSAATIAESLGGPYWNSFALALMIYFVVTGFLGSYLLTRLFLQKLLTTQE